MSAARSAGERVAFWYGWAWGFGVGVIFMGVVAAVLWPVGR